MKKLLSLALAVVLIICAVPFGAFTFNASAATEHAEGYYTYTVENGEATIISTDDSISGNITIPSILGGYPVTCIGEEAFYNCNELAGIVVPSSVTVIGDLAFSGCDKLTSITLPNGIKSMGVYPFYSTAYYYNENNWEKGVLYIGAHLVETDNTIPAECTIKNGTLTIAGQAFAFRDIESITIPDSVTSIGVSAFHQCNDLTSITIPSSVKYIGSEAFSNCGSLAQINVDKNNNSYCSIDGVLFNKDCTTLVRYPAVSDASYIIPDSVINIGENAFSWCYNLSNVTIPNNVISIGERAFYATAISDINIPSGIQTIEYETFAHTDLKNIVIPNNVISIGEGAFECCYNLINITLPNSVINIDQRAFYACNSLEQVTIPVNIKSIGESAFASCTKLDAINVEINNDNYCSIEGVLFDKNITTLIQYPAGNSNTTYILPSSVLNISSNAFENASNLTSIGMSDSVIKIGADAFIWTGYYNNKSNWENGLLYLDNHLINIDYNYSEYSCTIKQGTKTIADEVFYYCYSLVEIIIPTSVVNIGEKAINGGIIYGYKGSYAEDYAKYNDIIFVELVKPNVTGIYNITPSVSYQNDENIYVYDILGNEVKFNEGKKGWPLVSGQEYKVVLNENFSYNALYWNLVKQADTIFPDTSADGWYNDAVTYAVGAGIIGGYGNGKFGTSDSIQRQDFLVILARLDGVDLTKYGNKKSAFPDVSEGSYYEAAVNWGSEKGIVTGYDNGKFGVGDKVTREQLVTFLYRYAKYKGLNVNCTTAQKNKVKNTYSDYKNVSAFAQDAIIWAVTKGVINGKTPTTIVPQGNAQRCEVAQIMYNIFKNNIF